MTVRDLMIILESYNENADVIVRNHALDESNTQGNAYPVLDVQEGFFDPEIGSFVSSDEVDANDNEIFGADAVSICIETLE